jgi:activating signal cointegrator 1
MLTLSLTEPWASLVALQEKRWETRSWRLPKRVLGQEVAIHAAKGYPGWASRMTQEEPFCSSLRVGNNVFLPNLTRGKVLCTIRFIECYRTEEIREQLSKKEIAFGNYSDGRFAFQVEFVSKLMEPVPAIGHLGFWEWKK